MQRFGGYKQLVLTEWDPPIPGLTFGQPQVGVYFREDPERADIVTTWNKAAPHGCRDRAVLDDRRSQAGIRHVRAPHTAHPGRGAGDRLRRRS